MELESALQQAFDVAAVYTNRPSPKVILDRDFDFYRLIGQDISVINELNERGAITDMTFLEILKSGEILPDTIDLNKELRETKVLKRKKLNELLDAEQQSGSVVPPTPNPAAGARNRRPRNQERSGATQSPRQT